MIRFLGFFAEPAKTAFVNTACVVGATTLAAVINEVGTLVGRKVQGQYQDLHKNGINDPEPAPADECYGQQNSYKLS